MMKYGFSSFGIIGGDKRQLYCAKALSDDGYEVAIGGFDSIKEMKNIEVTTPFEAALMSEVIVLPLPSVNESGRIPAPFCKEDIALSDDLLSAMKGKKVFCGFSEKLISAAPKLSADIRDYYKREEFTVLNAVVTAEGAIELAMRNYEGTINGARCLVCGFGRIGKALSNILKPMGAELTVSARKPSDLAWIKSMGARAVRTDRLMCEEGFDIIFNTVPSKIFTCVLLAKIAGKALIVDLASGEGGVDFYSAERLGIEAIHALSLPGKCAPKTAGEIIRNTIYHILEEDDR